MQALVNVLLLTLVAAIGVALPNAVAAEKERADDAVLVVELRPLGISAEQASSITAQVAAYLAGHSSLRVMTVREVNALVEYQKSLKKLACESESCIAEMSRIANAPRALSGSVGEVGGQYVIKLSLLDTVRSEVAGAGSRTVSDLGELPDVIPDLVAETFGWEGAGAAVIRYRLPKDAQVSFAVFDLQPQGIPPDVTQNLTAVLAAEIKRIDGASVISRDDIASMLELEAEKSRLDCDDTACLAEIGGALGVSKLVVGSAGKLGDRYVISLQLIDAKQPRVDNRVSESFNGVESQLIPAARFAGRKLLGITAEQPGSLALAATQQQAAVFVDDEPVGQLPIPPVSGLTPGQHTLRISKEGYLDWYSEFYVDPGATTAVWSEITEEPERWYEKWWVWTIAGAVIVGGATAAVVASLPPPKDALVHTEVR